LQHWQGVVVSACEQCGRNLIPPVAAIAHFMDWLHQPQDRSEAPLRYLLDPEAKTSLRDLAEPTRRIVLMAGPEGGFDPVERQAAIAAGCQPVRLGPRILRTETAALAALAALQATWGDFQ
jgi:16S rRNA (uracil1498-N3)-methyltransferase